MSLLPFTSPPTTNRPTVGMSGRSQNPVPTGAIHPTYAVRIHQDGYKDKPPIDVTLHMPLDLSVSSTAEFDTPFADGLFPDRRIQLALQAAGFSPTVQAMTAHFWRGSSPISLNLPCVIAARKSSSEITDKLLKLKSLVSPTKEPTTGWLRAPGAHLTLNMEAAKKLVSQAGSAISSLVTPGEMRPAGQTQQTGGSTQQASQADSDKLDALDRAREASSGFAETVSQLIQVEGKISVSIGQFLRFDDVVITEVQDDYRIVMGIDRKPMKANVTIQMTTRMTPVFEDLLKIYRAQPSQTKPVGHIK